MNKFNELIDKIKLITDVGLLKSLFLKQKNKLEKIEESIKIKKIEYNKIKSKYNQTIKRIKLGLSIDYLINLEDPDRLRDIENLEKLLKKVNIDLQNKTKELDILETQRLNEIYNLKILFKFLHKNNK